MGLGTGRPAGARMARGQGCAQGQAHRDLWVVVGDVVGGCKGEQSQSQCLCTQCDVAAAA